MKLIVLKHLKGNAQIWSMSQTDLMKMDLQEWFKKMEEFFLVKTSSIELYKQLESRKWRFGESFGEYCSEKQILALPLQLHESSLIEYLIEGIPDLQLRNQARIRNFSRVADIKNAFAFIKIHQRTNSSSSIICYNCRQPGHIAARCRQICRKNPWKEQIHHSPKRIGAVDTTPDKSTELDEQYNGLVNLQISNTDQPLKALLDTGSPVSLIHLKHTKHEKIDDHDKTKIYKGIGGKRLTILGILILMFIFKIFFLR